MHHVTENLMSTIQCHKPPQCNSAAPPCPIHVASLQQGHCNVIKETQRPNQTMGQAPAPHSGQGSNAKERSRTTDKTRLQILEAKEIQYNVSAPVG